MLSSGIVIFHRPVNAPYGSDPCTAQFFWGKVTACGSGFSTGGVGSGGIFSPSSSLLQETANARRATRVIYFKYFIILVLEEEAAQLKQIRRLPSKHYKLFNPTKDKASIHFLLLDGEFTDNKSGTSTRCKYAKLYIFPVFIFLYVIIRLS